MYLMSFSSTNTAVIFQAPIIMGLKIRLQMFGNPECHIFHSNYISCCLTAKAEKWQYFKIEGITRGLGTVIIYRSCS